MGSITQALIPSSLSELQQMVRSTSNLRAVANGHAGGYYPAGQYLSLRQLNRVLSYQGDTITVEAGIALEDLIPTISSMGKSLATIPSIYHATVGGAMATASHGSGSASFASQVRSVVLVTADGTTRTIRRGDPEYPAVVASVGLLGVVYSVELEVVDTFTLYQQRIYGRAPSDPIGWITQGLYRQLFYNPYRGTALTYDHSRQSFGPDHQPFLSSLLNENRGHGTAVAIYDHTPWLLPEFINASYQAIAGRSSGPPEEIMRIPEYNLPYIDYEVSVPVAEARQAWASVQSLVEEWRRDHDYYLWFGIFLRYLHTDTALLSQSHGTDTIAFEFPLRDNAKSREFIQALRSILGNRWHPGKQNPARITDHHNWTAFDSIRRRLDPHGKFFPTGDQVYEVEFTPGSLPM